MNAEVKQLWIDALRSDEFRQGHNVLREQDEGALDCYCCLGVLCELYRRVTGKGIWMGSTFAVGTKISMAQLPDPVREWAELKERDPRLGPEEAMTAISMNDRGKSFKVIANHIEQYL